MKITIKDIQGNIEKQVEVDSNSPILTQLEKAGVFMQSACQAGICWACICNVESGGEKLNKNGFWEPGFPLADDEIMTCIWAVSNANDEVVLRKIY